MRATFLSAMAACLLAVAPRVQASTLFESGALGATGLSLGEVPGVNVSNAVFNGVRFELTSPVITSRIGGHFVDFPGTSDTLFGAIVRLDGENDFPDSGTLSTPDVLGTTLIAFPAPSAEVFGDLVVHLDPGWYALVFGTGLFGATGHGGMPLNNPDIGDPSYIAFQTGSAFGWSKLTNPIFQNLRFVVKGVSLPEPESGCLMCLLCASRAFIRRSNLRTL